MKHYSAKYSAIGRAGGKFVWVVLFFWTIIPLIIWGIYCFANSKEGVEVEDDILVRYDGFFNKSRHESYISNLLSVGVKQTFFGRMFNYGNVHINCIGKHSDLSFSAIKNPNDFASFLKTYKVDSNTKQIISE